MGSPKKGVGNELHDMMERLDAVCRESEFIRHRIDRMMKRAPVWPERRHSRPGGDAPVTPINGFDGDEAA
jgi:hypothetical protein